MGTTDDRVEIRRSLIIQIKTSTNGGPGPGVKSSSMIMGLIQHIASLWLSRLPPRRTWRTFLGRGTPLLWKGSYGGRPRKQISLQIEFFPEIEVSRIRCSQSSFGFSVSIGSFWIQSEL